VVANRVLPDGLDEPFFAGWKAAHTEHLAEIEEQFAPLPILTVPWQPAEPIGLDPLRVVAKELYHGDDPTARLSDGYPMRARAEGDGYVLELDLPFTDKDEVDLGRRGDELLVRVGPYRRAVTLPDALRHRRVTGAQLDGGHLAVSFG
jgi:arsenite-transporting ATPase